MYDYVARSLSLQESHAKSRQQGSYRRRVSNARPVLELPDPLQFASRGGICYGTLMAPTPFAKSAKGWDTLNRAVEVAPPFLGRESVAAATDLQRCRPIAVDGGTMLGLTCLVSRTMDQRLG
jgi:hypothetical protein